MNLHNRLNKLETRNPPQTKIYITLYGEDGRVKWGSNELKGMTRAQVGTHCGDARIINIVRASDAIEK